jgi:hypothetical protein
MRDYPLGEISVFYRLIIPSYEFKLFSSGEMVWIRFFSNIVH